ncbi:hypothetical protein C9J21_21795 [Photobacterium phosphoreum]|uniref:phosphoadenosine phosphosulfate reductase domain-containing protein n=1 Tax=Photobacterium phosphoreum TaxID=659 RepID=UPI000D16B4B1|nr:phosphoadenosine phosphosulfate reductase family protein [Photobacterium phosphoreum]PSW25210.1 hypothetical protein C9J21_21795 [Photobacterium phosphoreum]
MWYTLSTKSTDLQLISIINNDKINYTIRNNAWMLLAKKGVEVLNDNPSMRDDIHMLCEQSIAAIMSVLEKGHGLCVSVSWGKDSNCCLILALEAIKRFNKLHGHCPKCYVINSNTTIENPALDEYFMDMKQSLEIYNIKNNLDVKFYEVTPDVSSHWHYVTVGRGKLPRYPGMSRDCSVDFKIKPIKKLKKQLAKSTLDLCSIVGTRFNESEDRKQRMLERGDKANTLLLGADNDLMMLPIADWEVDDVWALLTFCNSESNNAIYQSFVTTFDNTIDIYRSANGGECVLNMQDKGQGSACGARFGCSFCLASGDKDKSLRAMIESNPNKYSYLQGISDLRDFMFAIRWDMTRREWLGRSENKDTGYSVLQPDYFNFATRLEILRYMLTLDAREQDWADTYNDGIVRFELVNYQQLIEIDLAWALYRDAPHAFAAIHEYCEIRKNGRRYDIGEIVITPKTSIPSKRWIKLPPLNEIDRSNLRHERKGLSDPFLINRAKENGIEVPVIKDLNTGELKEIIPYQKSKVMDIQLMESALFVEMFCTDLNDMCQEYDSMESVYYYITKGIILLSPTQPIGFDAIIQRACKWEDFRAYVGADNTMKYALEHSITDVEHNKLKLKKSKYPTNEIAIHCVNFNQTDEEFGSDEEQLAFNF